jgi:hypothetical protein
MKAIKVKRVTDEQIVQSVIEAEVMLAIGLGYSDRMIRRFVARLTKNEIYRISKSIGLRRRDYRDCESPLGRYMWNRATEAIHRDPKHIGKTTPKLLKGEWP